MQFIQETAIERKTRIVHDLQTTFIWEVIKGLDVFILTFNTKMCPSEGEPCTY